MRHVGKGVFRDRYGYDWPLWAVNAYRRTLDLPRITLNRWEGYCDKCGDLISENDAKVWDASHRENLCVSCGS